MSDNKKMTINIEQTLEGANDLRALSDRLNPILGSLVTSSGRSGQPADYVQGDHTKFGLNFSKSSV